VSKLNPCNKCWTSIPPLFETLDGGWQRRRCPNCSWSVYGHQSGQEYVNTLWNQANPLEFPTFTTETKAATKLVSDLQRENHFWLKCSFVITLAVGVAMFGLLWLVFTTWHDSVIHVAVYALLIVQIHLCGQEVWAQIKEANDLGKQIKEGKQ
jgi:hypothetical protein